MHLFTRAVGLLQAPEWGNQRNSESSVDTLPLQWLNSFVTGRKWRHSWRIQTPALCGKEKRSEIVQNKAILMRPGRYDLHFFHFLYRKREIVCLTAVYTRRAQRSAQAQQPPPGQSTAPRSTSPLFPVPHRCTSRFTQLPAKYLQWPGELRLCTHSVPCLTSAVQITQPLPTFWVLMSMCQSKAAVIDQWKHCYRKEVVRSLQASRIISTLCIYVLLYLYFIYL